MLVAVQYSDVEVVQQISAGTTSLSAEVTVASAAFTVERLSRQLGVSLVARSTSYGEEVSSVNPVPTPADSGTEFVQLAGYGKPEASGHLYFPRIGLVGVTH